MASFTCPQCHADVTKEPDEPACGCPCCGYAQDMAVSNPPQYFPLFPVSPSIPYTPPSSPWPVEVPYVGDPPPDQTPYIGDPIPNPWQTTSDRWLDITTGTGTTDVKIDTYIGDVSTGVVTIDSSNLKDMQFSWTN